MIARNPWDVGVIPVVEFGRSETIEPDWATAPARGRPGRSSGGAVGARSPTGATNAGGASGARPGALSARRADVWRSVLSGTHTTERRTERRDQPFHGRVRRAAALDEMREDRVGRYVAGFELVSELPERDL